MNSHAAPLRMGPHHTHHSLAISRPYTNERSVFRASKELFRFVMTTIVVANASKCTANAASIIANYHRTSSARNSRKSTNSFNLPSKAGVKENNINLWHFRTFSTCSAGSPFESDLESVFASPSRCARGSNAGKDVAVVTSSSRSVKTVSNAGSGRSADEFYEPPSLEVMRAQLGPVGSLVANAVEVGFTTASSYISGGLFGYFIGGAMGIPGVLRKEAVNGASGIPPMKSAVPNAGMKEIQRRIGDWNSKALTQGKSWGALSASFSGFHALARVCRGGVEDKWNSILGSAATGAYLSRQGGPQAMLQGASSYAGFTYILDNVFGSARDTTVGRDKEFEFRDTPVDDRGY
mmetsp:Transcript_21265/g.31485  ORF Transcript_21265/g.31485 Transcript_21265/m.31485 type:complete len:350 (+) Transcript_21265:166-1215(+)